MKNFAKFYTVFLIVMIAFALNSCESRKKDKVPGQEGQVVIPKQKTLVPGTKHFVVLLVDVDKIKPGSKPRDFCSFPDKYPYPNDSIENYTTDVLAGDSVVWLGISTSAPYQDSISIDMINHRSGDNVLGPQRGINGKVGGKIKEDAAPGQKEKYAIHFRVFKEGIPPRTYILDPKILVH